MYQPVLNAQYFNIIVSLEFVRYIKFCYKGTKVLGHVRMESLTVITNYVLSMLELISYGFVMFSNEAE